MEAIILAGGLGTRLRSKFSDIPKVMVPVAGRPFLEYLIDYLAENNINHAILSVGYLKEVIINHFQNNFHGIKISYAIEEQPLGTGGGIKLAMQKTTEDQAFILNGDTMFKVDLNEMFRQYLDYKAPVLLALKKLNDISRYGTVQFDDQFRITHFLEKQEINNEGYINGGIYLLNKSFFLQQLLPEKFSIEKDFFEPQVKNGNMYSFLSESYFIDIGIPDDYDRAQKEFKE